MRTFSECPSEVFSEYFTDNTMHSKPPLALQTHSWLCVLGFPSQCSLQTNIQRNIRNDHPENACLEKPDQNHVGFLGEKGLEYISSFSSPCSEVHPTPFQRGQMLCSLAQQLSVVLSHYFWLRIGFCVQIK